MLHRSYDAWKTDAPSGGGDADPTGAFWEGFRFALRQGQAAQYLDRYRGVQRFVDLVRRAEQQLQHPATCDCQLCRGAA